MGGKKGDPFAGITIPDVPDDDVAAKPAKGGKSNKRLSVERIYQKKTQLEHILLRPDTYIGSVEHVTQPMWVYDEEGEQMTQREVSFVPGLYKIFDEILVNAADNKQRDPKMSMIKIDIDPETNKIKIWNNGKGIPVVEHQTEKMFVPTLIFGHLLTSSNYDDSEKKVTGGRNGYGAKLCNIFSTKFQVETQSAEYGKAFKQTWGDNMTKAGEPKIASNKGEDYTCITFFPDLPRFKMEKLDQDIVDIFSRRAYDIAAACKGVKVYLNGKKLPVKHFQDYIDLYIKNKTDDVGNQIKLVYEEVNPRWQVGVALSDKGFQSVSFVNSIATTKGGRHVDYITDQIVTKLIDVIKKKEKKAAVNIKPFQVKNHLWVFVNCAVENPTFDSQTKENMTLQAKSFGSKCPLSENFITKASKCGIVESIQSWMRFKAQEKMNKKCSNQKVNKIKGIPKLDDANNAGTKHSIDCTLILTEGDSAKSLAVAGLSILGRDSYGVFPLKGKLLNVREASQKQIMDNAEINNIIKIVGLRYKEKYETPEALKTLRYGKIMIMTDQDQDGSHIKGLLINFVHNNWPNLLKFGFLEEFITPIVKVTKNKQEKSFYSLPEFEEWKSNTENWHTYKVKYYKGLGTSTSKEAKEYFSDMQRHRIKFNYMGSEDDASIVLAFSKKKIEERKEWLTNWMEERKRRAQLGLPELYLYGKETKVVTYNEFINRELILFSNMDNERSIPAMMDGLKPGQRKVLFTCFKRNLVKELKVAQLAGSVAEQSAYHHGETSLMGTIINLAQNFIGSNNVNLLQPIGQFGTRIHGGKDAASPRYIFTALSPLARLLFNAKDDPLLKHTFDDNQRIEPEWYVPIIPMVLVNGSDGIGTGWSTKIQNYDVREVVNNIRRMLDGQSPLKMIPCYKGFTGTIEELDDSRAVCNGEISILDDTTIEITELPVKTWTQSYKESVLEPMLQGTDKSPPMITDYKEYNTDTTIRFVVKMTPEKLAQAEAQGLHKIFKLQSSLSSNMVLFDSSGCIRRYNTVEEILKEFYENRLDLYNRRKNYLEGLLSAESLKLDNCARFIMEKIEGTITIENKPKKELIQMLVRRGYDSDPIKAWKKAQDKLQAVEENAAEEEEEEDSGPDFNYILSMALWCLTKEKKDELLKQRDAKAEELYVLKKKTGSDLWREDLVEFIKKLEEVEEDERKDAVVGISVAGKSKKGRNTVKKVMVEDTLPSTNGRRVEPVIDASMRAKSEAAAKKRKGQVKKEGDLDGLLLDDDDDEPKSLADRVGGSPGLPLKKEKAEPKPKKPRAPKKEASSPKKNGTPKKKGKGGKKKNPWSDSEEDEEPILSEDEISINGDEVPSAIPRNTAQRRAATKTKYTYSDEDSDVENRKKFEESDDDDLKENVAVTEGKLSVPTVAAKKARPETLPEESDEDDLLFDEPEERHTNSNSKAFPTDPVMLDDSEEEIIPKKKAPTPKKPAASKDGETKKKAASKKRKPEFDLSDMSDLEMDPKPKKPAAKKPGRKPGAGKKKKVGSDSDSDFGSSAKKPKGKTSKAKAASESEDDMDIGVPLRDRVGASRAKKPVKYNFGDDEDEESDF